MHFEGLPVPTATGLRTRLHSLSEELTALLRVALHPRARAILTGARTDLRTAENRLDAQPDTIERENIETWLEMITSRLRFVSQSTPQAEAPGEPIGYAEADAVYAIRVRHGMACVRAARLWADRGRTASDALVDTIHRLEDIGRKLAEERVHDRRAVMRLIESSLTIAERQLDGFGGAN